MKNIIKKTIFFASILLTTIQISALEEEKQESITTSDHVHEILKSFFLKSLGLLTGYYGLYELRFGGQALFFEWESPFLKNWDRQETKRK